MAAERNIDQVKTILVTGTKGKTTICAMLSHALVSLGQDTLEVNTLGTFWNNKQVTNYEDSLKNFGKSPNVMPGRHIYWHLQQSERPFYAVLEASLACAVWGTGLKEHSAGIFTNVFRDHLDFKKLKSEADIYERKSFIFKQLKQNGLYITSLDNEYTKRSLSEPLLQEKNLTVIAITTTLSDVSALQAIQTERHLADVLYVEGVTVKSLTKGQLYDLNQYRYYFKGNNSVMVENLLFTLAYLMQYFPVEKIAPALTSFMLPEEYGRFLVFENGKRHIVVDYSHEPESLKYVIKTMSGYFNEKPYVITRLAPDRNDDFIADYAAHIKDLTDISGLTIYDKVDGDKRSIYRGRAITRGIGESSQKLLEDLQKYPLAYSLIRIIKEREALETALQEERALIIIIFNNLEPLLQFITDHGFKRII